MTEEKAGAGSLTIEEALKREGKYVGPTAGVSMLPMLKEGRDTIVVRPASGKLSPLDVALYRRNGDYVLHRVISVTEKGYVIRGDNCYSDEQVSEERILGVLTEFFRGNKHFFCTDKSYLRYAKRRVGNYPLRRFFYRLKYRLRKLARRILKRTPKTKET